MHRLTRRELITVKSWKAGERPVLQQRALEGDPGLSL